MWKRTIFYLVKEMLIAGIVTLGKDYRQWTFFFVVVVLQSITSFKKTVFLLAKFWRNLSKDEPIILVLFLVFKDPSTTKMHKKMFSHDKKQFLSHRLTLDESNIPELQSCICSRGRNVFRLMPYFTADGNFYVSVKDM